MAVSQKTASKGKLRIGDDWNAITIIALSQSNPLKAVAEFVENSIDAKAQNITIVRGKEKGQPFLRITDDGDGVPKDPDGLPNFKYVATHVCDSIKRRMNDDARSGIQGEFGIGLLSFWTVGEELSMACGGADGKLYEMRMAKGEPGYTITQRRRLVTEPGTTLTVKPLLPGIRNFSGEKLQWYLASELRDRIRSSGVHVRIVDRQARAEFLVEPRQFSGRLLHDIPATSTSQGDIYAELYLTGQDSGNQVGLYRSGTRVVEDIATFDQFRHSPWNSGYLQGILDAPFLTLTPGTRLGVIQDAAFAEFCDVLRPLQEALDQIVEQQKSAEEEKANRQTLRSIQKAFHEALLTLPEEEYDWFDIRGRHGTPQSGHGKKRPQGLALRESSGDVESSESEKQQPAQKEFFEHSGPLYSVRITPSSCVVPVGKTKNFRAIPRDRSHRQVEIDLTYQWQISDGDGSLDAGDSEITAFHAPDEPALIKIGLTVTQNNVECTAEALVTVTDSLLEEKKQTPEQKGLPSYTFQKAGGQLWRSRFDKDQNVIVVNNGHRDFVYASRNRALKLRYICRLFAKELVYHNFPGYTPDQLLERMIELSLYTEENLH